MKMFCLGFLCALALTLVTTTSPDRAKKNVRTWIEMIRGK
jgi:hypothetical protein